jgi:3-hydroxyacyl-[acyl-carrier-protein] dehydratase|tara:strand:+ start:204 stop:653 length:450 start_codon:yes stop_codon:yes gene_type:complete
MILNYDQILEFQQNRPPYLMIDHADNVIPGKISEGYKVLNNDEWFFKVHWPTDPNMPGMLQVEALVQMGSLAILTLPGLKGKLLYLTSANKLKFYKKIIPGDKLALKTKVLLWKRGIANFSGSGFVNDNIVFKAAFSLILPEIIDTYKK